MTTQPPRICPSRGRISNSSSCPRPAAASGRGQQVSGWVARLNTRVISSLAPAGDTGAATAATATSRVWRRWLGCVIFIIVIIVTMSLLTEPRSCLVTCGLKYLITVLGCSAGSWVETPRFIWKYSQIFDCLDVPCPSADDDGN